MNHEHIRAFIMFEIQKALEAIQRRGVGYINQEQKGLVEYCIDGIYFTITVSEGKCGNG